MTPGVVTEVRVTPDQAEARSLGERITLQARALDGNGDVVPNVRFIWSSSAPQIAQVDTAGSVLAVAEGSAIISARTNGIPGDARVTVSQEVTGLAFLGGPHATLEGQALAPLDVAAVDRLGSLVESATGTVTLDAAPASPGALLGGPVNADMDGGFARFSSVRPDRLGIDWRLRASWSGFTADSRAFDVVTAFDRVSTSGPAGTVGLLIDGLIGDQDANDHGFVGEASGVDVGALRSSATRNEVVLFGGGRSPTLVASVPWTADVDMVQVPHLESITVDVTLWIVKGPFSQQRSWALDAIETTRVIWSAERQGVEIGDVEVVDATADPDAPSFFVFDGCSQRTNAEAQIGHRAGRLNIYYVERVDGGVGRGRACPIGGDFAVMAERSGDELLSHEIGHLFGLTHVDHLTDDFDRTNVMHSSSSVRQFLTEAQVYRSVVDPLSAINSQLGLRAGLPTRSCPLSAVSPDCPRIDLRLWSDGSFPANGGGTDGVTRFRNDAQERPAPGANLREPNGAAVGPKAPGAAAATTPSRVLDWLELSCATEDSRFADTYLREFGDDAVPLLVAVAARETEPLTRRLAALHGLGLIGTERAREALRGTALGAEPVLVDEARHQLDRTRR